MLLEPRQRALRLRAIFAMLRSAIGGGVHSYTDTLSVEKLLTTSYSLRSRWRRSWFLFISSLLYWSKKREATSSIHVIR